MNHWDIKHAVTVLKHALDLWMKRSKKEWSITVATSLVEQYPELARLPRFVPPPTAY
jgi:hypothetical protein